MSNRSCWFCLCVVHTQCRGVVGGPYTRVDAVHSFRSDDTCLGVCRDVGAKSWEVALSLLLVDLAAVSAFKQAETQVCANAEPFDGD